MLILLYIIHLMKRVRDKNGKWLDITPFRQEAINFLKNGYYTAAPVGTPDWIDYWKEQLDRCINGYSYGGEKITGYHYGYLNFAQIKRVEQKKEYSDDLTAKKIISFPDFWDGDYNYFWSLEIARNGLCNNTSLAPSTDKERKEWKRLDKLIKDSETSEYNKEQFKKQRDSISQKILDRLKLLVKPHMDYLSGGYHFIVAKSRRKGYSFKSGFTCANNYNTVRGSLSIIGAFDKKYIEDTMDKAVTYLDFFNEHTGFAKKRLKDTNDYKKAGYIEKVNGMEIEKGYKSVIDGTITFKDNPDKARGADAYFVLFEEAGAFPNLKDAFNATVPSLTAGSYMTGQVVIQGTSGDLEYGSADYADMFYNPVSYGIMPFHNIWDKDAEKTVCGFFHSVAWNMEGFYDEQGNSDVEGAYRWEMERRQKIIEHSSSPRKLLQHIQEFPLCPADAFTQTGSNIFPVVELKNQLNKVLSEKLQTTKGTPVILSKEKGKVKATPDLRGELDPIYHYKYKNEELTGAPIIYEYPIDNPPRGLYKIGYDPYRHDKGTSLASIIVYKGFYSASQTKNCIVAEYVGRPEEADDVNRIASMLADLYNAEIMHENNVAHIINYFRRIKRLDQLAVQPDAVISKHVKNSKTARVYGCHMVGPIKDAAIKYIKDWLLEVQDFDENGDPVTTIDKIYSIGLLEELIAYNNKDNFDRCLVQGTKIKTNTGYKLVEDVVVGDKVLTREGVYCSVKATMKNSFKDKLVRLSISGEAEDLIVTNNHPILVASTKFKTHYLRKSALNSVKYRRADSLTDKYQFAFLPKRKNLKPIEYEEDMLYLLGWIMSDGHINFKTKKIRITLSKNQYEIGLKLCKIINRYREKENYYFNKCYRLSRPIDAKIKDYGTFYRVEVTSHKIQDIAIKMGYKPGEKKLSEEFYNSSNLMPFIVGYFEGDGSQNFSKVQGYDRCNITLSTIYKELLQQVRQILIDNGIYSSISYTKKTDQLRLNISTNYIDHFLSFYKSLKFSKCNMCLQKNLVYETEEGFYTPIKIKEIIACDKGIEVYNFEVDTNHNYIANNIVTHNCMALAQVMLQVQEEDLGKDYYESSKKSRVLDILEELDTLNL